MSGDKPEEPRAPRVGSAGASSLVMLSHSPCKSSRKARAFSQSTKLRARSSPESLRSISFAMATGPDFPASAAFTRRLNPAFPCASSNTSSASFSAPRAVSVSVDRAGLRAIRFPAWGHSSHLMPDTGSWCNKIKELRPHQAGRPGRHVVD